MTDPERSPTTPLQTPSVASASAAQARAANPTHSAWVTANAGSGKTRVLINRVAQLLRQGARPARILCLTYTKAAAAEMQNRLFERLGEWAMLDDAALTEALASMLEPGERADIAPEDLPRARKLFAEALETPGGLKIQTIHAFCDGLLRRFPLEAGVSPRFEIADERAATELREEARDRVARRAQAGRDPALDTAFELIVGQLEDTGFDTLLREISTHARVFAALRGAGAQNASAHIARAAGVEPGISPGEVFAHWRARIPEAEIRAAIAAIPNSKPTNISLTNNLSLALDQDDAVSRRGFQTAFMRADGKPRTMNHLPTSEIHKAHPEIRPMLETLQAGYLDMLDRMRAAGAAEAGAALFHFAVAYLAEYGELKEARGLLDYDDLIRKAQDLLAESAARAWVLYKLDGGVDHILVDEAQDTSPAQWTVIRAIAEEFHVGEGARSGDRTIFVVGDEKQSIYSFQGADPKAFGAMKSYFQKNLDNVNQELATPELKMSFRSASRVLSFVDTVFHGQIAQGLSADGAAPEHYASRVGAPGRVDLWPLIEPQDKAEAPDWRLPMDAPDPAAPKLRLAAAIADEICRMLETSEPLPARGRPVIPGDFLILVRRRDELAAEIIRRLKARGVPVAGQDRLRIGAELAVKDLLALARVAMMPEDDLSLAALLRSPLLGWSETELFDLAHGRKGSLWSALIRTRARHPQSFGILADMLSKADLLRPYEFLERILIFHDGRRKLLKRLGIEAEDAIDELLAQTLGYEAANTPSLQGFIHWIEAADLVVKREQDHGAGQVRVMTAHGAKGLESRIVILPDTTTKPSRDKPPMLTIAPGEDGLDIPLLSPLRAEEPPKIAAARMARETEEHRRLLYVAMTRAEDWLIICGHRGTKPPPEGCWHDLARKAMERIGAPEWRSPLNDSPSDPSGDRQGRRWEIEGPGESDGRMPADHWGDHQEAAPAWLTRPAPRESRGELRPLAASHLGGSEPTGGGDNARAEGVTPESAARRGEMIHLLLETLPGLAPAMRPEAARRMLESAAGRFGAPASPQIEAEIIAEAIAAMELPEAAAFFAPDALAEVAVAAQLVELGGAQIRGKIDRMRIEEDRVRIVDFKSNAAPPARAEAAPEAYLRQLGAYAAAMTRLYPGKRIEASILWTAIPKIMLLPQKLMDDALARARTDSAREEET